MEQKTWRLGKTKTFSPKSSEWIYLEDFKWESNWGWWWGGYIRSDKTAIHFRNSSFDTLFLKPLPSIGYPLGSRFITPWQEVADKDKDKVIVVPHGNTIRADLSLLLDCCQYDAQTWARIKDLFLQFYRLWPAVEVFKHGGDFYNANRTNSELSADMAYKLNQHIEDVIIFEIRKALNNPIPNPVFID